MTALDEYNLWVAIRARLTEIWGCDPPARVMRKIIPHLERGDCIAAWRHTVVGHSGSVVQLRYTAIPKSTICA